MVKINNPLSFEKPIGIGPNKPKNETLTLLLFVDEEAASKLPTNTIRKPIIMTMTPIPIMLNSLIISPSYVPLI